MSYIGLALLLLMFGSYLLFGDSSYLPSGKISIDFGKYKNIAGAALIYVGMVFGWLGIRSFKTSQLPPVHGEEIKKEDDEEQ